MAFRTWPEFSNRLKPMPAPIVTPNETAPSPALVVLRGCHFRAPIAATFARIVLCVITKHRNPAIDGGLADLCSNSLAVWPERYGASRMEAVGGFPPGERCNRHGEDGRLRARPNSLTMADRVFMA